MNNKGFTLVELMVVLVLVATIAGIAVPSYNTLIANNRITSNVNAFLGVLSFARTEALKRGRLVRVSATTSTDTANEWGPGYVVWFDADGDVAQDAGEEIRVVGTLPSTMTLNSVENIATFSYRGNGFLSGTTNLSFTICDDRTGETGRLVQVGISGRVTISDFSCG